MCGICGQVRYDGKPVDPGLLRKMNGSMACRGPDDEGIHRTRGMSGTGNAVEVGLGHRRLSVIDLSSAGHQPLANEDGSIWITYNGEIYDFQPQRDRLLQKGHVFRSHTDTEVIVHAYEETGPASVREMNGMFSFALWDGKTGRLWACRDRIGIKPFVYFWDGTRFSFASEIKALLCDPSIPRELDEQALYLYLTFNFIPAPLTIFKGIRKLEPGHMLTLENGKLTVERYWDLQGERDPSFARLPFEEQKERCRAAIDDAVKSRMVADVPLGAFLSGGIDSSIVVALMARHAQRPVKTFSIGFGGTGMFDETDYAREVARRYETDHHEFHLTPDDMLSALPEILGLLDEPFADSSAIPTYIVSRETRRHVTVALSGDGGDELFAGYRSYLGEYWLGRYRQIPGLLRTHVIERLINRLPDSRDRKFLEYVRRAKKFVRGTHGSFPERLLAWKEVFPPGLRRGVLLRSGAALATGQDDPALATLTQLLDRFPADPINQFLYTDLAASLPGDMLTKVDLMSMGNALEVRVPLLDHRVVELAFSMEGTRKIHRGRTKAALVDAFLDVLPKSLHRRPKAGFEVPIARWLRKDLKFLIDEHLNPARLQKQGVFHAATVSGIVDDHLSGRTDTSWMIWNLIAFQEWYDRYF